MMVSNTGSGGHCTEFFFCEVAQGASGSLHSAIFAEESRLGLAHIEMLAVQSVQTINAPWINVVGVILGIHPSLLQLLQI